ncbi:MAG TPA: ABC transporter substrate-binding protein [Pyrinomonadaceae bacterium]|nr:ABC transporter substrate-binding protein [Pyrinomonadaceae bacterium]
MTSAKSRYFGKTSPPNANVLRYISGSEPESLDPQIGTGQPEARVYMALYEGLVEYDPKTMEPRPELATNWEISPDAVEYLFHLRKDAKWSNGDPITANDFVFSFRRGFAPETASRNANLGYYIKYAEPYNNHSVFMKGPDGNFYIAKDFAPEAENGAAVAPDKATPIGTETETSKMLRAPAKLTLNGDTFKRAREIQGNEKLKGVFKFNARDFKNPIAFTGKVINGKDGLSQFLRENLSKEALEHCIQGASCDDAHKQVLADGLNKLMESGIYDEQRFAGVTLSKDSQTLLANLAKENKKRADEAKAIDDDIAQTDDAAKKEEKAKLKKKQIANLFYLNRFLLEDVFKDDLAAADLITVEAKDIGVEAIDDYTLRITLTQPAPYFMSLLPHQFFRLVPQKAIEKFGKNWVRPENIVTCGPFKVKTHRPYDTLEVVRDPNYWDAATVKLDEIDFYPLEENTTMLNLYKSGSVDALYNHTVPASWVAEVSRYTDEYLKHPEVAMEYYSIASKKPPMDNVYVRKAFSRAVDREAIAKFRGTVTPLLDFTPEGIFPAYEEARKKIYEEARVKRGMSPEEWTHRNDFNPEKACALMAEAGYKVTKGEGGRCTVENFPVEKINITYNTLESNRQIAEMIQSQWKQNLGITVPLKNMEWKTFLPYRSGVQYEGFTRNAWSGDYMDPFTFLNLFYSEQNDGATGWHDQKYDDMLDNANKTLDPQKRFELLAQAELYVMDQQIVIPLQTQSTNWIKKPYVKGMYPNPGTLFPWKFVYIERDTAKWDQDVANIMKAE